MGKEETSRFEAGKFYYGLAGQIMEVVSVCSERKSAIIRVIEEDGIRFERYGHEVPIRKSMDCSRSSKRKDDIIYPRRGRLRYDVGNGDFSFTLADMPGEEVVWYDVGEKVEFSSWREIDWKNSLERLKYISKESGVMEGVKDKRLRIVDEAIHALSERGVFDAIALDGIGAVKNLIEKILSLNHPIYFATENKKIAEIFKIYNVATDYERKEVK